MKGWILSLIILLVRPLYGAELTSSFYTDDSRFYLKLHSNGFTQLFRLERAACNILKESHLVFKSKHTDVAFKKLTLSQKERNWPRIYRLNNSNYCWYEARANNLNLNNPQENLYAIRLKTSSRVYFFGGFKNGILPKSRITQNRVEEWIQLGAHGATIVEGGGVFFKLWEPTADEVHLFTNENKKYVLRADQASGDKRSHVIYLRNGAKLKTYYYQFMKEGKYEFLEVANNNYMSAVKIDPMAKGLTYDAKGGHYNGYINPRAKIVKNHDYSWRYDGEVQSFSENSKDSLIIYQLWPLTFNPKKVNGRYVPGTFDDITEKIGYLENLGINTVEMMPIHETRFHASWGYAMDSILLIENNYGSTKSLKKMVDQFHKKNIKVFLDVVINHVNNDLIRDPLSKTVHNSKFYEGNTGWGPKPRFRSVMVQKWIMDSLLSLQREFHIDGFRFDMVEHIYHDSAEGYRFLQELNTILKSENKNFHNSAEQLPDNVWATYSTSQGGLGYDSQWNDKFKNSFETNFDHYREHNRVYDPSPIIAALMGFSDHYKAEHHFGDPMRTVNYVGSHDFVANKNPILRMVSDYESYEWVDHLHFYRVSPLSDENDTYRKFRQIHNQFTHNFLKMAYGITFTKPGSILFFQGEELAQDLNLENEWSYLTPLIGNTTPSKNVDLHRYISSHRVPWEYLNPSSHGRLSFLSDKERELFSGHTRFFKKMIQFKKSNPHINFSDAYNVKEQYNGDFITYEIGNKNKHYFVVVNLRNDVNSTWMEFPGHSRVWWKEVFNSSHEEFGGESQRFLNIIRNVGGRSNIIRSKGPSIIVFENKDRGNIEMPLFFRSGLNNWQATPNFKLSQFSENQAHLYGATINVPRDQEVSFKLATHDWDIEMGASGEGKYLSYSPEMKDIKVRLSKGSYKFIFNIKTYKYKFEKMR